jgi:hypothetical protein
MVKHAGCERELPRDMRRGRSNSLCQRTAQDVEVGVFPNNDPRDFHESRRPVHLAFHFAESPSALFGGGRELWRRAAIR